MKNHLKEIRKRAGLSMVALAEFCGTSNQQISRLENGDRRLSDHWLDRLVQGYKKGGFDVSVSDLLGFPSLPPAEPGGLSSPPQESYVIDLDPDGSGGWHTPRESDRKAEGALAVRAPNDIGGIKAGQVVRCDASEPYAAGDVVYVETADGKACLALWRGANGMGPLIDMSVHGVPMRQNIAFSHVRRIVRAKWVEI